MQYDVKTPAEYIACLDDSDWRLGTLQDLRAIIKDVYPEAIEGINYKMLAYTDDRGIVFHLNAQKGYVSLYVGDHSKIDPGGELLKGLNMGKSCIRFKKSINVNETRIREFVQRTVDLWKQGVDFGC